MHGGSVVPAHLVLSHEEQLDRLRLSCPSAADRAIVAGDPCLDRLRASLPLRETYRQMFGVHGGRKLLFLTSTWGADSLYGTDPDLPARLAAHLPLDEFAIVVALHPNIEQGHQSWQLNQWLSHCRRSGVTVLPREDLWQQAAVAADVTVGDHGSVTFYSACLGTPVLLANAPHETVDPASPIAALLRTAPQLTTTGFAAQVADAMAFPAVLDKVVTLATSAPGEFAARMVDLGYRTLRLTPPKRTPSFTAFPIVQVPRQEPAAHWVRVIDDEVVRYAAVDDVFPADAHLVVTTEAPDPRLLEQASVILGGPATDPARWIAATLCALPGCEWAACPAETGWWAGNHDGLLVGFTTPELPQVVPSVLHTLGSIPDELSFTAAGVRHQVRLTVLIDDRPAAPATP
ncbi:hypothetical protein [Amycolatopsis panacis]|uniref:Uncharacterized protein n=1 Tax=Amycolatopsis panacis TaxID=2340917 RepID=A0A419IAH9_9PSEU|nr:hypothetical protein [Amycolatopsis panacis]RJQ90686.1 hypothetical protein D5S19_02930 [Amycolatopsis panacis]